MKLPIQLPENPTAQDIFTACYKGIVKQNVLSRDSVGDTGMRCLYRSPKGYGCAIGIFIDDETAESWDAKVNGQILNSSISGILKRKDNVPDFIITHQNLFKKLQTCHDKAREIAGFVCRMEELGKEYGWELPIV